MQDIYNCISCTARYTARTLHACVCSVMSDSLGPQLSSSAHGIPQAQYIMTEGKLKDTDLKWAQGRQVTPGVGCHFLTRLC